ncbi:mannonate dehydratase [Staphylococcus nepalensis]|uniref:Mannonate dehydratase n=1 Tax=Staphylococcus nepalensis TaxID=214473 RepID=A0ABS3L0X9_9STAP|nr:mannonate dehydratase [Staphylococcus nepalensis]MBO1206405.1 mannonate dehydratase [Staphylococcus nepalensis]MBO1214434.1 mannonate dehydratase [Staphylococcus nepalensis]MBO1216270.1 mannonate dehydratase [Staphylococcus nepalensis]MBO1226723.1 mannonate dehydratase [Staphylococcus nepalensis]MBO1233417.1 mannonate dehydratase [Staphylococcus nepalensis]
MELSFRWYGEDDPVTLNNIRQIPDMKHIVSAIYDIPVGEVWTKERIAALKQSIEDAGLKFEVVESLPVSEEIKLGTEKRDELIENYKTSLINLAENGIKTVTYNFMPVFDWTRSQLDYELPDGSNTLIYNHNQIKDIDPLTTNLNLPGWDESYSRKEMNHLISAYRETSDEQLWDNLKYFLDAVLPTAIEHDVDLAIHPDDPPWAIFGIPRIIKNKESYERLLSINNDTHNGICFCTGSLGSLAENDLPSMIRTFGDHIHFVHMRNVKRLDEYSFVETGHLSKNGSIDMKAIAEALRDIDFKGTIRPDHGRMIWGETGKAGYGLFDRALGATYINGLIEGVRK